MNQDEIKALLNRYDKAPLECDGLTRVITTELTKAGVSHTVKWGTISHISGQAMTPHFWVELPDGHIVDYRAKMWLGAWDDIPHGVFKPGDYPSVSYEGAEVRMEPLTDWLKRILLGW
jgi:hypothetical protein